MSSLPFLLFVVVVLIDQVVPAIVTTPSPIFTTTIASEHRNVGVVPVVKEGQTQGHQLPSDQSSTSIESSDQSQMLGSESSSGSSEEQLDPQSSSDQSGEFQVPSDQVHSDSMINPSAMHDSSSDNNQSVPVNRLMLSCVWVKSQTNS